jgi:WD40 repeat protein
MHTDKIWSLGLFSYREILLAFTGGRDQTLVQYDLRQKKVAHSYGEVHDDTITAICSTKGELNEVLITGSKKTLKIWKIVLEMDTDKNIAHYSNVYVTLAKEFENAHENFIRSIAITPCGGFAFSAGEDKILKKWDLNLKCLEADFGTGEERGDCKSGDLFCVDVSPCGAFVFTGGSSKSLNQWDVMGGGLKSSVAEIHDDWVLCVRFSCLGSFLFTAGKDRQLKQWEISNE